MLICIMAHWVLIIYLIMPNPNESSFIVPRLTFQSQTECLIATIDMEPYLKSVSDYAITCVSIPVEKEA